MTASNLTRAWIGVLLCTLTLGNTATGHDDRGVLELGALGLLFVAGGDLGRTGVAGIDEGH